uniref:FHA domain-containing protein n=1 Tax=Trichuris muris TaxID=70415 RepID=A0A5S6QEB9_TRIMR
MGAMQESPVNFQTPSWATRPPEGFHLDVMKSNTLLQKLMIDEKSAYFFGRSPQLCDFVVDHSSCSRVHAVLVYHKFLKRMFLVDLGSTHGTFIGNVKLEAHKPETLNFDQNFRFGASTRTYILREKPPAEALKMLEQNAGESNLLTSVIDLPNESSALDRLTEYHTALNRRVISIDSLSVSSKRSDRPKKRVQFDLTEEIINPEDVDPTIGRFRNLVSTSLISVKYLPSSPVPDKQPKMSSMRHTSIRMPELDDDDDAVNQSKESGYSLLFKGCMVSASLNLAPEAKLDTDLASTSTDNQQVDDKPKAASGDKKKYPIEAWPGKYPHMHLLL